jgi:hypothetical protein
VTTPFVAFSGSAHAAPRPNTLPQKYAKFAHCPISDPLVTSCLAGKMTGTFQLGSTTLTLTKPAVVTFGLDAGTPGVTTVVLPTDGTPGLSAAPVVVPGGLLGIPGAPGGGALQVTAQPQLAGLPTINLGNLLLSHGTAISLPLDVIVANPLIGAGCTIGSTSTPLTLNLTDGTTDPPAPNTPVTGSLGTLHSTQSGLLTVKGSTLVDNAFAGPGTSGCGPLGILDPIINVDKGLPSAAGTNSATLTGNTSTVPASLIRSYLG